MDEVKALEENLNTNGEGPADLVTNGELESQIHEGETDTENGQNVMDVSGNSLPEQDTSNEPPIEQETSNDPKSLDSPIDDQLTPSKEPHIQHTEENEPDDHEEDEVSSPVPSGRSESGANDAPRTPELPSRLTNGEMWNHEEACRNVSPLQKARSQELLPKSDYRNAIIDTTAPFESVKAAVSMFGGIIDWEAHKIQTAEKRKYIIQELIKAREEIPIFKKKSEKAEETKQRVLKELDDKKRLVEELKLNLERTQTEECNAKQDAELAKLRVEEMEQGIADDSSVAAKVQLEVAHARHEAAVNELKTVKSELESLKKDYDLLLSEREIAIKNAKEAVHISKEIENTVEGLTIKLITTQEALESAHAAHLEAEEQRIGVGMAREQDALSWEKELKESEEELENVNQQIVSIEEFKPKLDTASAMLQDLKAELAAYMGQNQDQDSESDKSEKNNKSTHKDMQEAINMEKTNLEEVNKSIELATEEVKRLKVAATSLNSELEEEKATLIALRQREGMASVTVASLENDLNRTMSEISLIQKKQKEAREKAVELPKQLQKAAEEAEHAKSLARSAHEELQKAKEIAEQAKAGANTMRSRLLAAQKEIEAARASEKLALDAITALQETESAQSKKSEGESGVTISLEDYYELTRKAQEAETEANTRVTEAMTQIDVAKESESESINKLEQVNSDLVLKREELSIEVQKAENAKQGKLAVEQELRTWRSESEQRRKAKEKGVTRGKTPKGVSDVQSNKLDIKSESNNTVTGPSREGKPRKKKKSFFPRFLMFFGKKKKHSKQNT